MMSARIIQKNGKPSSGGTGNKKIAFRCREEMLSIFPQESAATGNILFM
jgi:hypothetical protein